jgi:hypothetical protein
MELDALFQLDHPGVVIGSLIGLGQKRHHFAEIVALAGEQGLIHLVGDGAGLGVVGQNGRHANHIGGGGEYQFIGFGLESRAQHENQAHQA